MQGQMQMQNQQMFYQGGNPMMVAQPVQFGNAPSASKILVGQPVQFANSAPAPQMVVAQPVQFASPAPAGVVMGRPKDLPGRMKCPYCQTEVVTETKYIYGTLTWVLVITLGICMIWPFCLIPLCCKDCEDVEHNCPNCNRTTHVHKRM